MDGSRLPADHSFNDGQRNVLSQPGDNRSAVVLQGAASRAIEWSAECLVAGGVIAMPTDTVYGIAASLAHEDAIRRIFAIKGRPADQPLPVLVSSVDALERIAESIDDRIVALLDRYWPGPLTVVVPAREGMPVEVLGSDGSVGVRLPNHPLAIEVIEKAGGAVACTSANRSGDPPAIEAAAVSEVLGGQLDLILDGGQAPGGVASTVVAVIGSELRIIRQGAVAASELSAEWQMILDGSGGREGRG